MRTVILLIAAIALPIIAIAVWAPRDQRINQVLTLVITLGGTFAGVWLGLIQSDQDKKDDEMRQVLALSDSAAGTLAGRWVLGKMNEVPVIDLMASNPLIWKYYDPKLFSYLAVFNTLMADSGIDEASKDRGIEKVYFAICLQRRRLQGSIDKQEFDKLLAVDEPTHDQMKKVDCYISKPFGTAIGVP